MLFGPASDHVKEIFIVTAQHPYISRLNTPHPPYRAPSHTGGEGYNHHIRCFFLLPLWEKVARSDG
jgi:hypothetical protein